MIAGKAFGDVNNQRLFRSPVRQGCRRATVSGSPKRAVAGPIKAYRGRGLGTKYLLHIPRFVGKNTLAYQTTPARYLCDCRDNGPVGYPVVGLPGCWATWL